MYFICCEYPVLTGGLLLLLVGLLKFKHLTRFQYYIKFAVYVVGLLIGSIVILIYSALRGKRHPTNIRWGQPFATFTNCLLGVYPRVTGPGLDFLSEDASCVVLANHQTNLDLSTVFASMLPYMNMNAVMVAKRSSMYWFPWGTSFWACSSLFIDRSNSKESQILMNLAADKAKLWIYPEGTRSNGAQLLPFKKGAFHIAIQKKLPIVPIVVAPYTFVDDKKKTFDSGILDIHVLEPIFTDNIHDVNELVTTVYSVMNSEFQNLCIVSERKSKVI